MLPPLKKTFLKPWGCQLQGFPAEVPPHFANELGHEVGPPTWRMTILSMIHDDPWWLHNDIMILWYYDIMILWYYDIMIPEKGGTKARVIFVNYA